MWGLQEDGGTRMADSTAPVHCRPMISRKAKTLQKEWLEKLGALQFVLTLYSGERWGGSAAWVPQGIRGCREEGSAPAQDNGGKGQEQDPRRCPLQCCSRCREGKLG